MILYSLKNASFSMDVYEDKVVFHPRIWKGVVNKQWENSLVVPYATLKRVELNKKYWPMGHQLVFHAHDRVVTFSFRKLYPFMERLQVYLERQIIRYYNKPEGIPTPMKTVQDIVDERKKKKPSHKENQLAA